MNTYTLRHWNSVLDLLELELKVLVVPLHRRCKALTCSWPSHATMDTLTKSSELFLVVQHADVQWDVLQATLGPQLKSGGNL